MAQMVPQIMHLANPVVGLAVMCAVHAGLCRISPRAALLNSLARAGLAGLLSVLLGGVVSGWAGGNWPESLLACLLVDAPIYACLAYGYANFVNLGQSSVRVRIYRELLESPDGAAIETLKREYDEQGMLDARLERLVSAGDLRLDRGVYRIGNPRLLHIAAVVFGLKRFVLGRHSEFTS